MSRATPRKQAIAGSPTALVVVVCDDGSRLSYEIGSRGLGWFGRGMQSIGRRIGQSASRVAWLVLIDSEPCIYNAREARDILGLDR